MDRYLSMIVLWTCLVPSAFAAKRAVLVGGSGEGAQAENFFKPDFEKMAENLRARGWEVTILFDGGRHKIEGAKSATNANIEGELANLEKVTQKGDQTLLFFHSHGAMPDGIADSSGLIRLSGTKTHRIVTEDDEGFNMDKLSPILKSLDKKGAASSVVDLSCYSGSTQKLPAPGDNRSSPKFDAKQSDLARAEWVDVRRRLCIGTLAPPTYVSICGGQEQNAFTRAFVDFPKTGQLNLEEQFMRARAADLSPANLPEISSFRNPSYLQWNRFITATDPTGVDRSKRLVQEPSPRYLGVCRQDRQNLEESIERLARDVAAIDPLRADLEKAIDAYMATFEELEREVAEISDKFGQKIDWGFEGDLARLNSIDPAAIESALWLAELPPSDVQWLSAGEKETIELIKSRAGDLRKRHGELIQSMGDHWKKYKMLGDRLGVDASAVAALERKVFAEAYKTQKDDTENPCKSFSL